jgi:hypothetical protein
MIQFGKFIELLNQEKVEFVLIGGAAMILENTAPFDRGNGPLDA